MRRDLYKELIQNHLLDLPRASDAQETFEKTGCYGDCADCE